MERMRPVSHRLGSEALLDTARTLAEANGAIRQRETFERVGAVGLAAWLADRFLGSAEP
jgi:hypothetical protein